MMKDDGPGFFRAEILVKDVDAVTCFDEWHTEFLSIFRMLMVFTNDAIELIVQRADARFIYVIRPSYRLIQ
ncbi:hypothetical protein [Bosea sp. TND4EK4]|uniref:hypothetical protein n=1 Tax=Bosea sp. TND4EK4 TaxID=1907408 RepID=UPI00158F63B9|nr:hypothetical protein [Bosea sp. TND4EK4]